jgi:hypothetical protein
MAHTQSTPIPAPVQPSISPDFTQKLAPIVPIRRYTVSYGPRQIRGLDGRPMLAPRLCLQGAWLERAGFATGVPVKVHVSAGRLVIEAAEPERMPRAEALTTIATLVADDGLTKRDFDELARLLKRRRCG